MVRGYFDQFPRSTFYFRRIRRFYILYSLDWDQDDPIVTSEDREIMQYLINEALGREEAYRKRKSSSL
ncbi:hypothetical protein EQV77_00015 [Halobacillus fulvus]|nr:hypothetical protein EQV77_00015 [Halobacillus fulvus]